MFDVESYICSPEDTSFEILSKKKYGSERYGQALQRYNRDYHFRGSDEPLRLSPGMQVYYPTLDLLETNYSKSIPNYQPLPSEAAPVRTSTGLSSPVGQMPSSERMPVAVPAPGAVPAVRSGDLIPANAQSASRAIKVYRVQAPGGEQMFRIAEKTLGNGQRWNDIYKLNSDLNPNLNPAQFLPVGTQLVLPPDARGD